MERSYSIAQDGAVVGDFTIEELESMWRQNEIGPQTTYLHPCGQWKPLAPIIVPRVQQQSGATYLPQSGVAAAGIPQGAGGAVYIVKQLKARSRCVYILLAILLGALGIRNFYAGHIGRGEQSATPA